MRMDIVKMNIKTWNEESETPPSLHTLTINQIISLINEYNSKINSM